jgi:hypothetical protein
MTAARNPLGSDFSACVGTDIPSVISTRATASVVNATPTVSGGLSPPLQVSSITGA